MLLVQLTVNGTVKYFGDGFYDIEHFYEGYVASLSELRISTRQLYGGFYEPSYGNIEFLMSAFEGLELPPTVCHIKIGTATVGESDFIVAVEGTAYLSSVGYSRASYAIYGTPSEYMVTDAAYSGTLLSIFQSEIPKLGYTLNYTYARTTQPMVDCKYDGEGNLLDQLSEIAAFFSHRFYLQGSVIHLVDCLRDFGTLHLDEFSCFAGEPLTTNSPVKQYVCKYTPDLRKYHLTLYDPQTSGSTYLSLAEMEMFLKDSEKDLLVSGSATITASSQLNSSNAPSMLMDNNVATQWATTSGDIPAWLEIEFTEDKAVDSYVLQSRNNTTYLGQTPTKGIFYGWEANENRWRKIHDLDTEKDWEVSEKRNFSVGEVVWDLKVASSYSFAQTDMEISPVCHTNYAEIKAAMLNIKTMQELFRVQLIMPFGTPVTVGGRIELVNESMMGNPTIWCRVSSITWDLNSEKVVVEGEGGIV